MGFMNILRGLCIASVVGLGCASGPQSPHLSPDAESAMISAWNTGNVDSLNSILHEELRFTINGCMHDGRQGYKNRIEQVRKEYTGFRWRQVSRYVDGDTVIAQWRWKGRAAVTEKEEEQEGISLFRFEDGQVVESHFYFDEWTRGSENEKHCPSAE